MNNFNYAIFEILKYKIELYQFLEYGLPIYQIDTSDISSKHTSLKSTYENGVYKDVVQSLFSNYTKINQPIKDFLRYFTPNKILKITKTKKLKSIITYHKKIIDCYETINSILLNILDEKEVYSITNKIIIDLQKTSDNHFINFLFFNIYHLYIECTSRENTKLKFKDEDLKELASLIKYCNKSNIFDTQIDILLKGNKEEINSTIQELLNKCIDLEKKLNAELNEIVVFLNKELETNKK